MKKQSDGFFGASSLMNAKKNYPERRFRQKKSKKIAVKHIPYCHSNKLPVVKSNLMM